MLVDLHPEFRVLTNGRPLPAGNGLLGALAYFGLSVMSTGHKDAMRALVLRGGPWTNDERKAILDYCADDVMSLLQLWRRMASKVDLPRALVRARYAMACAAAEHRGVPVEARLLERVRGAWPRIKDRLVLDVDAAYGVYVGGSFNRQRFEQFARAHRIAWPRHESGALDLREETFHDMVAVYPVIAPLRDLRRTLSSVRLSDLAVGPDGRHRAMLSPFGTKTGRNAPSTSKYIFNSPGWVRGFIRPTAAPLGYVDWCQQEFGIAAALSQDGNMLAAYESGDPYLEFGRMCGRIPPHGTKQTHPNEREMFKTCVLGVQYQMGAHALALRLGLNRLEADDLLALHRRTFGQFWSWSQSVVDEALLTHRLLSPLGWILTTTPETHARTLRNFPMQSAGADMLRVAMIDLAEQGAPALAPVHDALLVELDPKEADASVQQAQAAMATASRVVLDGFELRSDIKVIAPGQRFLEPRGKAMWDRVMNLLARDGSDSGVVAALPARNPVGGEIKEEETDREEERWS